MATAKIVILNWNGEDHLRRFLPSVVAAAPNGVEVIVADNGSTDGSVALLGREFPTVTLLRMDRNYGLPADTTVHSNGSRPITTSF